MKKTLILFSALLSAFVLGAARTAAAQSREPAQIDIITESDSVLPGKTLRAAIRFRLDEDTHTYWINPGDSGLALIVDWKLPAGWTASPVAWPHPERFELSGIVNYGYEGEVLFPVTFTAPKDAAMGTAVSLRAKIDALVCREACLPLSKTISARVQVIPLPPIVDTRVKEQLDAAAAAVPAPQIPESWVMKAQFTDTHVILTFTAPEPVYGIDSLEFFPLLPDIVDYGAKQKFVRISNNSFALSAAKSASFDAASAILRGIVVINHGKTVPKGLPAAFNVNAQLRPAAPGTALPTPVTVSGAAEPAAASAADSGGGQGFELALFFAFVGGLLLNLMPCVLPMLSIKILGFVNQSRESAVRLKLHGLVFGAGIILSFWVLAGTLLILRAGGQGLGWGFQLQSPYVLATLALLFFAIGLNLFGVFEIGTGVAALAGNSTDRTSGLAGSFLSGVLMTIIATPCTAPFMGSALGYALTLPALPAMLVFTMLALGLALPYTLISFFPPLLRFVPRPGAWMDTFKQFFGFVMMAVVIELGWVFGRMQGLAALTGLLFIFLYLSLGAWAYGVWAAPGKKALLRKIASYAFLFVLLSALVSSVILASRPPAAAMAEVQSQEGVDWEKFSPETLDRALSGDRPVFLAFSAAWCLSCTVNESMVFSKRAVREEFDRYGAITIKADWTNRDEEITAALARYGRSSVPFYVLYGQDRTQPRILPELLSKSVIADALSALARPLDAGEAEKE